MCRELKGEMMANDLVLWNNPSARSIEQQLEALAPQFSGALSGVFPVGRLIQTVMVSLEKTPKLYECNRQSILTAALSAACLGLEVDGVTGQAFLIPFKGRAQLVTGYKGYNTLAARGSYTIRSGIVREGQVFEYDIASAEVVHRAKLGDNGRIIATWARAVSKHLPPVLTVIPIDEVLALKQRSPGGSRAESPWNDPVVGFPAMVEKTSKRRLARSMPLNILPQYGMAARMDEATEEQGMAAHITPERGVIIEAEVESPLPPRSTEQPRPLTASAEIRREFRALPAAIAQKAELLCEYLRTAPKLSLLEQRWKLKETRSLLAQVETATSPASPAITFIEGVYDSTREKLKGVDGGE